MAKRKRKLTKRQIEDLGWDHSRNHKFGGLGTFAMSDRLEMAMNLWNDYILEHTAIKLTPQFRKQATQISGLMYDLYNNFAIADSAADAKGIQVHGLDHLDKHEKKQVAGYDAIKALRDKWNDAFVSESFEDDLAIRSMEED